MPVSTESSPERIRLEFRGSVAVVTLNIPEVRNALSLDNLARLGDVLENLNTDDNCRAIVLTGAGGHFCAGGDVKSMREERTIAMTRARFTISHRVTRGILYNAKPVVAAVEGYAVGAGLSLAAAADYVVCSSTARFASSFGKIGILPDLGLLWTLPQRIGLPEAKRMIATTRTVDAEEASTLGLADSRVEEGQALDAAIDLAQSYNCAAPLPVALMKYIYAGGCSTLEDALRAEVANQPGLHTTADHREAVSAFLEKREPTFVGR